VRYLACSDLHLGAGADLGLAPGERLAEQRVVWETILDLAAERDVDAILFGGDAVHRNKPTPEELMAFAEPLASCSIPVFAINGNAHDFVGPDQAMAVNVVSALSDLFVLATAPNVDLLPGGAVLASLPWSPVSRIVAAQDGGDRDEVNQLAADLLLEVARGLAADCDASYPGAPRILMTHFAISGDTDGISTFAREPVLPLADLEQLDFDIIVAGHFHHGQMLASNPSEPVMPILYCGSPMPLNYGEGSYDHGVWILEWYEDGWMPEFVPLASRSFVTLEQGVDLTTLPPLDGSFVKVRGTMSDEDHRRFDVAACRERLELHGAYSVTFDLTVERAHRDRGAILVDGQTRLEQLAAYLAATGVNGSVGAAMMAKAEELISA